MRHLRGGTPPEGAISEPLDGPGVEARERDRGSNRYFSRGAWGPTHTREGCQDKCFESAPLAAVQHSRHPQGHPACKRSQLAKHLRFVADEPLREALPAELGIG